MHEENRWTSKSHNIGKAGSEGGKILLDEELTGISQITIEKKSSDGGQNFYFAVTVGIDNLLVHTGYYRYLEDAEEAANTIKILLLAMENLTRKDK